MKGRGAAFVLACTMLTGVQAQLVVNNTFTVTDLVQNVLLGGGVTVSNVTFNGLPGNQVYIQAGTFDATNAQVGMQQGILLCSGDVNIAVGPNNNSGSTLPLGGLNTAGDVDLDAVSSSGTNDAAVLEFDFIPAGDSLSFNYVFASEEYLEYVNAGYNDVFGFFLSGPGINGPFTNNATNIALIPNTSTPVSIDNVNTGSFPQYYVDNGDGFTPPYDTDQQYIQFDGRTAVLTAFSLVQCGQSYHLKIAIADAGDAILDSGVFLEAGSFSSPNAVSIDIETESSDGTMTEGCTNATFTISRPGSADNIDITITVGGTATNGTDYAPALPTTINLPSGQTSVSFPVNPVEDNLAEGPESIVLTAMYVNACGDTSISVDSVLIVDHVPIVLQTEDLVLDCTQDSVLVTALASGGYGALSYMWSTGSTQPTTWVPGLITADHTITVTDECNKAVSDVVSVESGCEIIIPNVFSPNGDGKNDYFVIEGITGTRNTVKIFNRWGRIVYEATNYRNQWDGDNLSDGTYFYEVLVEGDPKTYTGHVTILKNGR
ncbi:MAG: choice-of-anchor L domain-containing protein [Flavobacteriales bacterium]|nr:choice-of-anchor L domain-containing protein [Flavobacteriales bacterium]